jgi:hypothetical protein
MIAWLRRLLVNASDYEGPAKVEVFGHDEHVGWARSTLERIDILTIEGSAIQIDARARFRLTPITWNELAHKCLKQKSDLAYIAQKHREQIRDKDAVIEAHRDRIGELRESMGRLRYEISEAVDKDAPIHIDQLLKWHTDLEKTRELDEDLDEGDRLPF